MLVKRILTSVCVIPILSVIIWFGEPYLTILVSLVGLLAAVEFYRLNNVIKEKNLTVFGIVWILLLIAVRNPELQSLVTPYISLDLLFPLIITSGLVISLGILLSRKQKQNAFVDWSWTLGGILYVGWLLSYVVALRALDDGKSWLFLAIFATFGSDSAAFFIGRAIGKHKLTPAISPKKTWEGAVGGLLGAIAVSLLFLLPTSVQLSAYLNWWQIIILGLLISLFGQQGDLVESLLKRNTGVKDSGNFFPGHGGFLDRIDSIIFAVVVVYYWVLWSIY